MGSQIELNCVDSTCDQVMGFDQLVANARTAREVFRLAMGCADAIAKRFDEDQSIMRDAIVLTSYTPRTRGFMIKLPTSVVKGSILATFRRGTGQWMVKGPLVAQDVSTLKPRPSGTIPFKIGLFFSEATTRQLPNKMVEIATEVVRADQREKQLSRRRSSRHSREEQAVA